MSQLFGLQHRGDGVFDSRGFLRLRQTLIVEF